MDKKLNFGGKKTTSHSDFLDRLSRIAERKLSIDRYDRGFKRAIAKALNARDSTVQRWFKGSYPEAEYLIRLNDVLGISPNALLGLSPDTSKQAADLLPSLRIEPSKAFRGGAQMDESRFKLIPLLYCCTALPFLTDLPIDANDIEDWTIINKGEVAGKDQLISIRLCKKLEWSMFPILKPLDIVIVDMDDREIKPFHMYVVLLDDHITVRRIQQATDQDMLFIPENKGYPITPVSGETKPFPIIGKVICSISHH
jgi:hypothetical protein